MKKRNFEVHTDLTITEYVLMTRAIVSEYFNENGEYTPEIGELNAMRLFYNNCVETDIAGISHDIEEADVLKDIIVDDDFIHSYNDAISNSEDIKCDFGNAYKKAMLIVENEKSTTNSIVNKITAAIQNVISEINGVMTPENIDKISEISKSILSGDFSPESVVNAFIKENKNNPNTPEKLKNKKEIKK